MILQVTEVSFAKIVARGSALSASQLMASLCRKLPRDGSCQSCCRYRSEETGVF